MPYGTADPSLVPGVGGYWLKGQDGQLTAFGAGAFKRLRFGDSFAAPMVGAAPGSTGNGYWEVVGNRGIRSYRSATFLGSTSGRRLNAPVVGMARASAGIGSTRGQSSAPRAVFGCPVRILIVPIGLHARYSAWGVRGRYVPNIWRVNPRFVPGSIPPASCWSRSPP